MALVRIDAPGAGDWIMSQVSGVFSPGTDHSFSSHTEDGELLGGIVTCGFFGHSMACHMAGQNKRWFSRELAWLVFDYCFNQVGCHKVFGGVRASNHKALSIDMRGGWKVETVIRDAFDPGDDLVVLYMTRDTCPWLGYQPKQFRSNITGFTPGVTQDGW